MYKVWTGICPILGLLLIHGYVSFTFHLRNTVTLLIKRIIGIQEALYVTQMLHTNYSINPNIIGFSEWAIVLFTNMLSLYRKPSVWLQGQTLHQNRGHHGLQWPDEQMVNLQRGGLEQTACKIFSILLKDQQFGLMNNRMTSHKLPLGSIH